PNYNSRHHKHFTSTGLRISPDVNLNHDKECLYCINVKRGAQRRLTPLRVVGARLRRRRLVVCRFAQEGRGLCVSVCVCVSVCECVCVWCVREREREREREG